MAQLYSISVSNCPSLAVTWRRCPFVNLTHQHIRMRLKLQQHLFQALSFVSWMVPVRLRLFLHPTYCPPPPPPPPSPPPPPPSLPFLSSLRMSAASLAFIYLFVRPPALFAWPLRRQVRVQGQWQRRSLRKRRGFSVLVKDMFAEGIVALMRKQVLHKVQHKHHHNRPQNILRLFIYSALPRQWMIG